MIINEIKKQSKIYINENSIIKEGEYFVDDDYNIFVEEYKEKIHIHSLIQYINFNMTQEINTPKEKIYILNEDEFNFLNMLCIKLKSVKTLTEDNYNKLNIIIETLKKQ